MRRRSPTKRRHAVSTGSAPAAPPVQLPACVGGAAAAAAGVAATGSRHGVEPREHLGGDVERGLARRLRDRGEQRAADLRIELGVERRSSAPAATRSRRACSRRRAAARPRRAARGSSRRAASRRRRCRASSCARPTIDSTSGVAERDRSARTRAASSGRAPRGSACSARDRSRARELVAARARRAS